MLPILNLQIDPTVSSPNGSLNAFLSFNGPAPHLLVTKDGRDLLDVSPLGLDLVSGGPLSEGLGLVSMRSRSIDVSWKAVSGKASRIRDHFREATFVLKESHGGKFAGRELDLIVRAYDDGIAFRYIVPNLADASVREELTAFHPAHASTATALVLPNTSTPYEELYQTGALPQVARPGEGVWNWGEAPTGGPLNGKLIGLPLLLQPSDRPALAFTEADLNHFPGLYLVPKNGVLKAHLSPRLDGSRLAARLSGSVRTPWRVVMVGDPKRLVESNLVLNLNPPSVLKDTSWIHPGKTLFPWWNGYDTGRTGIRPAQTTEYHKWCIDFAAAHGIPYHTLDGLDNVAWYGGPIVPYGGGPITAGLPGLDLPEILRYAKGKGVRIRVWMSSAAAKAQMAVAYPAYRRMGIEGVMVDFFDHDDQETVDLVHRVVETAAICHLTVTLHNLYKPTGLQRTYPNLLTFEAARNLEFDKWDPVGITPEHELTIPFVRMLAGPVDFHAGSFRNVLQKDYRPVNVGPVTIGTRAHQLARYVVYEDALNMVADSPVAYEGQPGFSFLAEVPTVWDETRVLQGEVGRSIVVARRKGRVWYLGAMTDAPRRLTVPLSFLGRGRFTQESWTDGADGPTSIKIEKAVAGHSITLDLAAAGGAAIRLSPR